MRRVTFIRWESFFINYQWEKNNLINSQNKIVKLNKKKFLTVYNILRFIKTSPKRRINFMNI